MGYDVGNIVANMLFAWINADATMDNEEECINFKNWVENTICEIIDKFKSKFLKIWKEEAKEILAKTPGFADWYLSQVIHDTAAVAGLELCRRIVGMAHVKDITSIENESARLRAERICITVAKRYIKNRKNYIYGEQFVNTLKEVENEFPG